MMTAETLMKELKQQHKYRKMLSWTMLFVIVAGVMIDRTWGTSYFTGSPWGTQMMLLFVMISAVETNSIGRSLKILGLIAEPTPVARHENPPEPPASAGQSR